MRIQGKKVAFVFPGQGSQYIGMGVDYIEKNRDFQQILDIFRDRTGHDLFQIMRDGPEETLKETRFTQPAILLHSIMALHTFLAEIDIAHDYVAGHSLGEFSALVATGVLDLSDALYLVHKRGEFMIKANDGTPFAMAAVLGLEPQVVKEICEEVSQKHLVVAANYNTPVQTVISGTAQGVELATMLAKEKMAKRVMPLVVGGPFHSPLVQKAATWLAQEMSHITFHDATVPIICNVNARPETSATQIVKNLTDQVTSSVLWVDTIKYLSEVGTEIYIEFGPQKVLSGMIVKIDEKAVVYNVDKLSDIPTVVDQIKKF
jgi:[acyl-carrier-protein] S-malonyltransferase